MLIPNSRFALGGRPFLVRIFLGDVPQGDNVSFSYENTPTQVGSVFNFSSPANVIGTNSKGCDNCKRQEENHALMTGQVIITDPLVEHIQREITHRGMQLRSLDREDVITYLKTNLHWRITDVSPRGATSPSSKTLLVNPDH
jgi:tyrosinase